MNQLQHFLLKMQNIVSIRDHSFWIYQPDWLFYSISAKIDQFKPSQLCIIRKSDE